MGTRAESGYAATGETDSRASRTKKEKEKKVSKLGPRRDFLKARFVARGRSHVWQASATGSELQPHRNSGPRRCRLYEEIILVEGQLGQATIRHDDDQETISNFPPQPLRNVAVCDLRLEVFAEGWIGLRASTSFLFFDMRPKHGLSGPRTVGTLKSCQPTHAGSSDI